MTETTKKLWRWIDLNIYCRRLYQPHMKIIHYFGFHWFTRLWPIDGQPMLRCSWCGEMHIIYRNGLPEPPHNNAIVVSQGQTNKTMSGD